MDILVALVLTVLLLFFLLTGVPIAVGLGLSSLMSFFLVLTVDRSLLNAAQKMINGLNSFPMLALPFFILAGNIMNRCGIAQQLIRFASLLGGRLPGYLAHTNIIANTLFGAISGSSSAAAAAMGSIIDPLAKKQGYPAAFRAAINVASAPIGLLIPPSGALIVYSTVASGTSIAALFVAGYIPGLLMAALLIVIALWQARSYPRSQKHNWSEKLSISLNAIPALFLIIVVIGGIIIGIFTATEGSAVAVFYAFIIALCYRRLNGEVIKQIFRETLATTGMVLFLIGSSLIMSYILAYMSIPETISRGILALTDNHILILLLMNFILLAVGTFMDMTPALLIFTPIFLPIAENLGMHPVHFGIMLILNLSIGLMTPPVGAILFIGSSISQVAIEQVARRLLPMFLFLIVLLLIITYLPALSLWLPTLTGVLK